MSMAGNMNLSTSAPAGMGMNMSMSMDMDMDMPHSPFGPIPQYGFASSQGGSSSASQQQQQDAMVVDRQSNPVAIDTSFSSHGPRSPVDSFGYGSFSPAPHQQGQTSASFSSLEGALSPTSPFGGSFGSPTHSHTFSPTREHAYSPTHEHPHRTHQMPFGYDQQQSQQQTAFSPSASSFMGLGGYDYPGSPPAHPHVLHSPGPSANPSQVVSFASRSGLSLSPHSHSGSSGGSAGTGRGGTDSPALSDLSAAVSWHTATTPEPRPGTGSSGGGRGSLGPHAGLGIGIGAASNEDLSAYLLPMQSLQPLSSSAPPVLNDDAITHSHLVAGAAATGTGTARPAAGGGAPAGLPAGAVPSSSSGHAAPAATPSPNRPRATSLAVTSTFASAGPGARHRRPLAPEGDLSAATRGLGLGPEIDMAIIGEDGGIGAEPSSGKWQNPRRGVRRQSSASLEEGEKRVALAPLESLQQRNRAYRRSAIDDRALRRLPISTT